MLIMQAKFSLQFMENSKGSLSRYYAPALRPLPIQSRSLAPSTRDDPSTDSPPSCPAHGVRPSAPPGSSGANRVQTAGPRRGDTAMAMRHTTGTSFSLTYSGSMRHSSVMKTL